MGAKHAEALARLPVVRLVAVCDADMEVLRRVGSAFPGVRLVPRAEEILDDPEIEVVSIATYDDAHASQVVAALERGKHVFVEKPLCTSVEEASRIWRALSAHPESRISSNLILRMVPRFRALRDRIRAGDLGRIYYLDGDYNYGRLWKITEGWRGRIPFYSVFLGGGIHIVDLFLWLLGDRIEAVLAAGTRLATEGTAFRYPDTIAALLEFRSGAVAKVSANFACVYPHFHRFSVYGTHATFENDVSGGRLFRTRDAAAPEAMHEPYPCVSKGALLPDFIQAVRTGAEPEVGRDDLFHGLAVCLAVERSLRERRRLEVREVEQEIGTA